MSSERAYSFEHSAAAAVDTTPPSYPAFKDFIGRTLRITGVEWSTRQPENTPRVLVHFWARSSDGPEGKPEKFSCYTSGLTVMEQLKAVAGAGQFPLMCRLYADGRRFRLGPVEVPAEPSRAEPEEE